MTTENTTQHDPKIDPQTAHDAYEALREGWQQRPSEKVLRPRTSVFDAVSLGLQMAQQALADRDEFAKYLAQLDLRHIDGFRAASLGLWAAETRWRTSRRRANQDEIDATATKSQETRRELLAAADYIWRDDERVRKLLSDIRQGAGQKDLADDLQRLADLFRTHWDKAKGRSEITKSDVDNAAKLAISLFDEVLHNDQAAALELRNRAWSHWYESYTELYAGGRYIHRHNPKAATLYPSLSYQAARASRADSTTPTPAPTPGPSNGENRTVLPTPTPTDVS